MTVGHSGRNTQLADNNNMDLAVRRDNWTREKDFRAMSYMW